MASPSEGLWDPDSRPHAGPIPIETKRRLHQELQSIFSEPQHGIIVEPDETNLLRWHALIVGPEGTPYEGGFFYFVVQCPPDYPSSPPLVKLMTTGGGTVRFNPNLYANGKVGEI
jgi:ubiquitin-conjugating enzyme E2 Z